MPLPQPRSRRWRACGLLTAFGVALLCASCDQAPERLPVFPAQGKVLYKGQPITPATVVLHPRDAGLAERPVGKTRQDGSFRLGTYSDKDGAPAGDYDVTVVWTPAVELPNGDSQPGPNKLPARYSKPATSRLHVQIHEGNNDLPTLELKD